MTMFSLYPSIIIPKYFTLSAAVVPVRSLIEVFNLSLGLELGGMVEKNLNRQLLLQNKPRLNAKSLHSTNQLIHGL